jgi:hypothetical protein
LLTPGQYRLLGAKIVVLLKEITELPLLPIYAKLEAEPLCETTRLELEYGIALFGYMLEVAREFYDNTVSLEGRTNKTTILLVEFWWWLHRKIGLCYEDRSRQKEVFYQDSGAKSG